jgi:hypothetical protein
MPSTQQSQSPEAQAIAWCEQARRRLKVQRALRKVDQTGLGKLTPKVTGLLASLRAAGLTYERETLSAELQRISQEINQVLAGPAGSDTQRAEIRQLAVELGTEAARQQQALDRFALFKREREKANKIYRVFLAEGGAGLPGIDEQFKQSFVDAQLACDARDYTQARLHVDQRRLAELLKDARKELGEVQQETLDSERYRPVYEDSLEQLQQALDELGALPGAGDAVQKLEQLRQRAEDTLTTKKSYKSAAAVLKDLQKLVEGGRKAAAAFRETGGGDEDYLKARVEAVESIREHHKLTGGAALEKIAAGERALLAADRRLEAGDGAQAVSEAEAISAEFGLLNKALKKARQKNKKVEVKLKERMAFLSRWAPEQELTLLLARYRGFEAMQGLGRYDDAAALAPALSKDVKRLYLRLDQKVTQWEQLRGAAEAGPLEVLNKAGHISFMGVLLQEHPGVEHPKRLYLAYTVQRDRLDKTRDLDGAIAAAREVLLREGLFSTLTRDAELVEETRVEARQAFQRHLEPSRKLMEKIVKRRGSVSDEAAEIAGLERTLESELEAAFTPQAAKAARDKAIRAVGEPSTSGSLPQRLAALASVLKTAGDDHPSRQKAAREAKEAEAAAALEEDRRKKGRLLEEISGLLTQLYANSPKAVRSLRGRAERAREDEDVARSLQELEAVKLALNSKLKKVASELKGEQEKARELLEKQRESLQVLSESYAPFKPHFKELGLELDAIERALGGGNLLVARQAGEDLKAFKGALTAERTSGSFGYVVGGFEKMDLGNAALKECLPSRRGALKARKKRLWEPECYALDAAGARARFDVYQAELTEALVLAGERQSLREQLAQEAEQLRGLLKDNKTLLSRTPRLLAGIEEALDRAGSIGEGGEAETANALRRTRAQLETVRDQGPGGLQAATWEGELVQAGKQAVVARKRWKGALSVFGQRQLAAAVAAYEEAGDDVNKGRWRELQRVVSEAKSLGEKKLFEQAHQKLKEASLMAVTFADDPYDPASKANKYLPHAVLSWGHAARAFTSDMAKLTAAVKAAGVSPRAQQEGLQVGLVVQQLDALTVAFDARIFNASVEEMARAWSATPRDRQALRAEKEAALRHVRRYQDFLARDSLLRHVSQRDNPFGAVELTALSASLEDLELNFKRY